MTDEILWGRFYLEYVYYKRKEQIEQFGEVDGEPAPGVYSARIQRGGVKELGAIAAPLQARQGHY